LYNFDILNNKTYIYSATKAVDGRVMNTDFFANHTGWDDILMELLDA